MLPHIFYFNPTCEMEVANGLVSYMPPRHLQLLRDDLSALPLVFANSNDAVLVHALPDAQLLSLWEKAGFSLPQFVLSSDIKSIDSTFVPEPWGLSPAACKWLHRFGLQWDDNLRPFFSRQFALEILLKLQGSSLEHIINTEELPRPTSNMVEVGETLTSWGQIVIKSPYSCSGRGVQILRQNILNDNIFAKTNAVIKQQGLVMLEPLLDKICDFAYEFHIVDGKIQFLGYSYFNVNDSGQYEKHHLPFDVSLLPDDAQALWHSGLIDTAKNELITAIESSDLPQHYNGYFGVDAMVYKRQNGEICLQPCIEINLRYNMGIVAWALEQRLAPKSRGQFFIKARTDIDLSQFDAEQQKLFPLATKDEKVVSGYLPITVPTGTSQYIAYVLVTTNNS